MQVYVCKVCGYISINGEAPEHCPVCNAPKTSFEEKKDAIKQPQDANNLNDLEKKHIPVITLVPKCDLVEGCRDIHVNVGEIKHPMQDDHYIMHIDFYLNKEFISRVHLTPTSLNAAAGLHLKDDAKGKLTVIEFCNKHGYWMNETEI
jgi:superoxide reductase